MAPANHGLKSCDVATYKTNCGLKDEEGFTAAKSIAEIFRNDLPLHGAQVHVSLEELAVITTLLLSVYIAVSAY